MTNARAPKIVSAAIERMSGIAQRKGRANVGVSGKRKESEAKPASVNCRSVAAVQCPDAAARQIDAYTPGRTARGCRCKSPDTLRSAARAPRTNRHKPCCVPCDDSDRYRRPTMFGRAPRARFSRRLRQPGPPQARPDRRWPARLVRLSARPSTARRRQRVRFPSGAGLRGATIDRGRRCSGRPGLRQERASS